MSAARRGVVREQILNAAVQALAQHGYVGTTARSIASIGGFAPGVLYYYYSDLDEVLIATAEHTGRLREHRYREALAGVPNAVELVRRLQLLHEEDGASGHIEAVQELVSAARPGTALAAAVADQTRHWEGFAEQVLRDLLRGSPLAKLVKVPVAARAVIAYYLGMQTLTHLDGDTERARAAFAQAARLAAAFDKLPRFRRSGGAVSGGGPPAEPVM